MHTPSLRLLFLVATLTFAIACDKDDAFKDAASVEANANPSQPVATKETKSPGGKLKPGATKLPGDHPPIPGSQVVVPTDKAPRPQIPVTANKGAAPQGPVTWTTPQGWKAVTPSSKMRMAQFVVPGPEGMEAGELTVFYFGAGGGGGVDANVKRWVGQFKQADGSPSDKVAKRSTKDVNGMKIHLVDVSGTFNAGAAMMGGGSKSDQRALGAIAESPKGLVFFKLVGPTKTVAQNEKAFTQFVDSFKPM